MNKPTLTHMSRFDMKRMLKNNEVPDNTLIISINDTETEIEQVMALWKRMGNRKSVCIDVYRFSDDNESFLERQAEAIQHTVDVEPYSNIIVHCFLGISRSAAVAKWLNDYLQLDIPKYNEYRQHNIHVYDTLCKVSGVENINNYYRDLED